MAYLISAIIGYFLGCSNMALYISKYKKINLRECAGGNLGTANSVMVMGWLPGIIVFLHDAGKAVLTILIARFLFPEAEGVSAVAGVACVLGHMFPVFLKFRGGKGFASFIGMMLMLNWQFGLCILAAVAIVTLATDYLAVGTAVAVLGLPIFLLITNSGLLSILVVLVATVAILAKHTENYVRIAKGTEYGLRKSLKKEYRVENEGERV